MKWKDRIRPLTAFIKRHATLNYEKLWPFPLHRYTTPRGAFRLCKRNLLTTENVKCPVIAG